jgi:hypothetical protein
LCPNHCEEDIYINGDAESLKAFKEFAKGVDSEGKMLLDMDKFIPYPQKFTDMDELAETYNKTVNEIRVRLVKEGVDIEKSPEFKKAWDNYRNNKDGYNSGGYQWCIDNWGTKWNFYETELLEEDYEYGTLKYTTQTAWSPPFPIIVAMSKKFPDLEFDMRYFEQGAQFNGQYVVKNGEITTDEEGKYFGKRGG